MRIYISALIVLLLTGMQGYAQHGKTDSLKHALSTAKEDTVRMAVLSELSFAYVSHSTDTAMLYVQQQLNIAERANLPKFTANAYNDLAIVQYYTGDYTNALMNNKKALEIRQQIGDPMLIISSLNKIGVIYQETANFEQATAVQLQVLKLAEQIKNEQYVGMTLNNIAYLYQRVKKYDEALQYSRRSLAIAEKHKDTLAIALAYASIEGIYEKDNKIDSAIQTEATVLTLLQKINALAELAQSYNDMGLLYRIQHKDEEGLKYYKKALTLAKQLNNINDQAFYSANIGTTYEDLKQADSGYTYLRTAYALNESNKTPSILKTIYAGLSTYFIFKNRPDSAIYYFSQYRDISDTLYSATSAQQINELMTKYKTEEKEQQITLLNEQNKVKQLTIDRKNATIGVIAGIFGILALVGILFYNKYKTRQEARLQDEILKQQQLSSKAVIAAEELERKRIAGDLHDGIGQMFSAVKMNLSGLADRVQIANENDRLLMDKTMALVDESCKEVRTISHQMMPNVLLRSGLSAAIRDFIDKIDEHKLKITLETFGLQQPLDSSVETVLYRIIQESVNNVIKHAKASTLDIQLHKDAESITVTIEDNGIGFDLGSIKDDKGIGLKSIRARAAYLDGKVDYDTAPGKGTLVAIFIPNKQA